MNYKKWVFEWASNPLSEVERSFYLLLLTKLYRNLTEYSEDNCQLASELHEVFDGTLGCGGGRLG